MAVRPNSKSLSVAQGKGLNLMLAKVSAAMESIETYHAENVSLELVTASYEDLAKEAKVCNPHELNLHPLSIYHEKLPIPWVKGFDLIQETDTFVPYDLVHVRFLRGLTTAPVFFRSSTGLASGNHILEAVSHGICEVIERDATALWDLCQVEPEDDNTIVDPATIDSAACRDLLERIEKAGLFACIYDQTSDVGVPSFGCVITERQPSGLLPRHGTAAGYGCHLSKEIAIIRAVTEAAQSRLTHISGARDDMYRNTYLIQQQSTTNYNFWERTLAKIQPSFDYTTLPSLETDNLEGDVLTEIELLQQAGFEHVIVVDLTDPRFGIPVAKVIIPRVEYKHSGFHKRYGQRARDHTLRELVKKRFLKQIL
jgi:ribosomal protein S12 methylthiotransferase accessory factor